MTATGAGGAVAKIEIKHRFFGEVLFAHECEGNTLRLTVEAAVRARISIADANLVDANLADANLARANLARANLAGANAPVIPHIDAAILRAIETSGNLLDMSDWHICATTHCRAGWAITLACSAGAELEACVGPSAAGALIYAASRPNQRVPDFFASDEDTLADLRACAAADPLPAEAI